MHHLLRRLMRRYPNDTVYDYLHVCDVLGMLKKLAGADVESAGINLSFAKGEVVSIALPKSLAPLIRQYVLDILPQWRRRNADAVAEAVKARGTGL